MGGVLDAKYERGRQTMEHTGRNPMSTYNTYIPRFKSASALQHPMGCLERIVVTDIKGVTHINSVTVIKGVKDINSVTCMNVRNVRYISATA